MSHRYVVFSIDYKTHTVLVSDADIADEYAAGCPRLHVNLTIDTVWLRLAPSASNITFLYSCKRNITLSSAVELSGCQPQQQDGNRSYVLRDGGITGAEAYEFECEEVVVAPVLDVHKKAVVGAPGGPPPGNGSFREVLQGGFELNYDTHNHQCDRCEGSGGWCGYQRDETHAGGLTFTCFCEGGRTTDRCVTGMYVSSSPALEFTSLRFSCLIALIFWVMERGVPVVHLSLRAHVFVCLFCAATICGLL